LSDIEVIDEQGLEAIREHSYFMSVDVPSDVPFAEFILSDEYNLFEFLQEADRKA